jgi:hypothetical protein
MLRTFPLIVLIIGGCAVDAADEDPNAFVDLARVSPNGTSANGITAGIKLTGVAPTGVTPNGTAISIAATGAPLTGAGVVGSTWTGHVLGGADLTLRVDDAVQDSGVNSDIWMYKMSVSIAGRWTPLCVDASGAQLRADTVRGTWNLAEGVARGGAYSASATDFTVACRGSAIAKCLELGYKAWTGHTRVLAACVRALRADYCGDGKSYTVDGTLVNIFDIGRIEPDGMTWTPEAEWTANGASCVSAEQNTRFFQTVHQRPSCFGSTLRPKVSCGTGFSGEATIITELAPR